MNELAKKIFLQALQESAPSGLVEKNITKEDDYFLIGENRWKVSRKEKVYVIAIGKAGQPMALALQQKLEVVPNNILCITPDPNPEKEFSLSSSHPYPDEKSVSAGSKLVKFVQSIPRGSVIFFALSGGASSLVCQPVDGISIDDINKLNQLLIKSGLDIKAINIVRKHLSIIKGGQLLEYFPSDCTLINLIISDVPNDGLETIGSGLTIPDSSTFNDARQVLLKYDLWQKAPQSIQDYIQKGSKEEVVETMKPGDDPLENHHSSIIGSAKQFAEIVANEAEKKGLQSWVAEKPFNQSVKEVAKMISSKIEVQTKQSDESQALVFYGESTVKVTGSGKGGRNQELALYGALEIEGLKDVIWLSAGTDGVDGPTDAAGAIVDGQTIKKAFMQGLTPRDFLENNDSYHFHKKMGTLFKTGPTGNNVMDVVIVVID